jgi:hypothetical protein
MLIETVCSSCSSGEHACATTRQKIQRPGCRLAWCDCTPCFKARSANPPKRTRSAPKPKVAAVVKLKWPTPDVVREWKARREAGESLTLIARSYTPPISSEMVRLRLKALENTL